MLTTVTSFSPVYINLGLRVRHKLRVHVDYWSQTLVPTCDPTLHLMRNGKTIKQTTVNSSLHVLTFIVDAFQCLSEALLVDPVCGCISGAEGCTHLLAGGRLTPKDTDENIPCCDISDDPGDTKQLL